MTAFRGIAVLALWLPGLLMAQVQVEDRAANGRATGSTVSTPVLSADISPQGQLLQQLYQLQQEVSLLRGMLEEQDHRIQRMAEEQQVQYEDLDRRLQDAGSTQTQTPERDETQDLPADAAPAAAAAVQAEPDPEREKLLYDAAFDLVRDRNFPQAIAAYSAFLRRYPQSDYAGNAQYWLGELYLAETDLESAEQAFQRVLSNYPGHRKEADTLYKLGELERKRGNQVKAREWLQRVLSEHAASSAAQLARRDLALLD